MTELQNRGFRIIPATEALAHEAGAAQQDLVSPTEDEEYLRNRFEAEVVALPAL